MKQHSEEYLRRFGKRRNRLIRFMVGLLCVCVAFAAGFLLRGNTDFLGRLGFNVTSNVDDVNPAMTYYGDTNNSISARISEVEAILGESSLDVYDLDSTTESLLDVLTQATGDPYASYLDQSHYETYISAASDSFRGVGILFGENDGQAFAADVFSGSEAEAKGVQAGDYVVSIDGDRASGGWTQAEVVKAIGQLEAEDGDDDPTVAITWRRPVSFDAEGGTEYTVELTVSRYEEPNVTTELVDGQVGYIKLSQITSNSTDVVDNAVKNLENAGAQCYVLDLRDNPGGYLTQAIDIGSLFTKSGTFVQIQTKESTISRDVDTYTETSAPLVVLVNGKTAAAAEVLAGGLQDNERATLVGETTMGRGSVQSVKQLSFGGGIRYTSAYYLTPKGYEIDGKGITPDVQVAAGSSSGDDSQKSVAVDTAVSLISNDASSSSGDSSSGGSN